MRIRVQKTTACGDIIPHAEHGIKNSLYPAPAVLLPVYTKNGQEYAALCGFRTDGFTDCVFRFCSVQPVFLIRRFSGNKAVQTFVTGCGSGITELPQTVFLQKINTAGFADGTGEVV
jgi:hypothetical protein